MRLLLAHTNYPAQFRRLVPAWVAQGHDVVFIAKSREWHAPQPDGYRVISYKPHRDGSGAYQHPFLRRLEAGIIEGQSAYRAATLLLDEGWQPDFIISHVGFGSGLFLKELFPHALKISFFEWYYNYVNSDVDFFPPRFVSADHKQQLKVWNTEMLHELVSCDHAVVPTHWQLAQFPKRFHDLLHVIHEGVDTSRLSTLRPSDAPRLACLPQSENIQVLTYVSRCFEDYRGFPQVVEVLSQLLKLRPNLHVLMVGQDCTAYGTPRPDGIGWSDWARKNTLRDSPRIHWLGSVQYDTYHQVLACSDVHLYLTIPFILSWSLLEAMAAACPIVSCATPPVQEVLEHDKSALLSDFFDVPDLVRSVQSILDDPTLAARLGSQAQSTAQFYSFERGLAAWNNLLNLR